VDACRCEQGLYMLFISQTLDKMVKSAFKVKPD
jgi:hypothetical protein